MSGILQVMVRWGIPQEILYTISIKNISQKKYKKKVIFFFFFFFLLFFFYVFKTIYAHMLQDITIVKERP